MTNIILIIGAMSNIILLLFVILSLLVGRSTYKNEAIGALTRIFLLGLCACAIAFMGRSIHMFL